MNYLNIELKCVCVCVRGEWTQRLKINWPKRVTSLFCAAPSTTTCTRILAALYAITSASAKSVDPGSNPMTTTSALLVVASPELWSWMLHGGTWSLDWGDASYHLPCQLVSCSVCHVSHGGMLQMVLTHSYTSLALRFPLCSSLHLYLHLVYKWNQLIKLHFIPSVLCHKHQFCKRNEKDLLRLSKLSETFQAL